MNIAQYVILSFVIVLLFKKDNTDAFIIFMAYCFYAYFIVPLEAIYYYPCSAMVNLIAGLALCRVNKLASLFSLSLVFVNTLGFVLWYKYFPPTIYNNISMLILFMQLITILPKGLLNGFGYNNKHNVAWSAVFNSIKARATMRKTH